MCIMAKGDKSSQKDSRFKSAPKVESSKRGAIQRTQSRFANAPKVTAPTRTIAREKARKLGNK